MASLVSTVHVRDAKGAVHVFGPEDTVPGWAAKLIPNSKAWDSAPPVENEEDPSGASAKPFSQLNKGELEKVASDEDVDLTGLTTNDEFRAAIKAARDAK
jgi:hypothetical protein